MLFRFSPEAEAELTEAREWYSRQRKDLDLEFMECIDEALSRVVDVFHSRRDLKIWKSRVT